MIEITKKDLLKLIDMAGYYISDYETYSNGMIEERALLQKLRIKCKEVD